MTKVKGASKRGQQFWSAYENALSRGNRTLNDVYGRCSSAKKVAYNDIRSRMMNDGGHDLAVIASTCSNFSTAYMQDGNLIVDTRTYTYFVEGR